MLEMAGVIKLMVDDPNFGLPEGKATIDEFLSDAESYNDVVAEASEGGEDSSLSRAMEETLNDPSSYYLQNQDWSATWELHEDDTRLRVTSRGMTAAIATPVRHTMRRVRRVSSA